MHNIALIGQHTNRIERGECLVMRGALVAIGTRSGAVYVYHVDGEWRDQVRACNINVMFIMQVK